MSPWWLLAAPAAVAVYAVVYALAYFQGSGDGYEAGYKDGQADLEEAMADEARSVAALCNTLGTDEDGMWALMQKSFDRLDQRRNRDAHSDALPDLSRRREVAN